MLTITHKPIPEDLELKKTAHEERHLLETVQIPIVTVSATFKEELEAKFGNKIEGQVEDVTFSRAHYSMANALVVTATKNKKTFWMIDPTNYVSARDWPKILFTQKMGRIIARNPLLKEIKDLIDTRIRNQLPLTSAIRTPLEYVFGRVKRPIISLHYEAGNILIEQGHSVLQVVTDPHVRPQYITHANNPRLSWCVFDAKTKAELIELAYINNCQVDEKRVTITGCPVDPRIPQKDKNQATRDYRHRPLRLAITTGGLGTNKGEIEQVLNSLAPMIKKKEVQVAAYAGVHDDFESMFLDFANSHNLTPSHPDNPQAPFRIFKGDNIIDSNELLLDYIFPWADGFISKPSGDMAYEAVAAGCFLLSLNPWGEWEENIRSYFEQLGVSIRVRHDDFAMQLHAITTVPVENNKPWVELALEKAQKLQHPLARGATNILKTYQKLK